MKRKVIPTGYSHSVILYDSKKTDDGKIIKGKPYGAVDLANNGQILSERIWK